MAPKIVIPVESAPSKILTHVSSSSISTKSVPSKVHTHVSSYSTSTKPAVLPKVVIPVSSSSSSPVSPEEEITSQPKKREYPNWDHDDFVMILKTMADLRRRNMGIPKARETLKVLNDGNMLFRRRGVHVRELSNKICKLRNNFKNIIAIKPCLRRWFLSRNHIAKKLFQESAKVWPELLEAATN